MPLEKIFHGILKFSKSSVKGEYMKSIGQIRSKVGAWCKLSLYTRKLRTQQYVKNEWIFFFFCFCFWGKIDKDQHKGNHIRRHLFGKCEALWQKHLVELSRGQNEFLVYNESLWNSLSNSLCFISIEHSVLMIWLWEKVKQKSKSDWLPQWLPLLDFLKHMKNSFPKGPKSTFGQNWVSLVAYSRVSKNYTLGHKFHVSSVFGSSIMGIGNFRNFPENFWFFNKYDSL